MSLPTSVRPACLPASLAVLRQKPLRKTAARLATLSAAVASMLGSAGVTQAASSIFDGDAAIGNVGNNTLWTLADNWSTNGVPDTLPADTDNLTFGGGTAGAIIDLAGNRVANSLIFNRNYTLGLLPSTTNTLTNTAGTISVGTGTTGTINAILAGSNGLALTGGGTLVLNRGTGNTFTGNVTVDGAGTTLAFVGTGGSADQTALGAGAKSITLTNGATISIVTATANPTTGTKTFIFGTGGATANVASGLTFQLDDAGQFSGTGNITKTGDGIFFLNNQAFTYTGTAINVNAGTFRVGANAGVLGTGTVAITVASGATWDSLINLNGTKNFTVGGTGFGGNGALIASSGTGGNIGGSVTLTSDTSFGGTGNLTIGGVITDGASTFNVSKVGTGTTILTNTNTWSGNTTISGGAIRGTIGTNLPTSGNLTLNGGAFETVANYTGTLGTGAGQVQLPGGSSGFSSGLAGGVTVALNTGAPQLVWGTTANFNPSALVLSQGSALGALTFQNPIDLNGASRTFTTNAAANSTIVSTLGGAVTGNAGLIKTGSGVLVLGSTGNAYTGDTVVNGGLLRGTLGSTIPLTGNLNLNGGALESGVNVTSTLGTGAGQVQLPGGASGFSAFGAATTVNLGGAGASVQWGSATFNPSSLVLNAASSNNTIDFQNPIDLNAATRIVLTNAATSAATAATLSGPVTGAAGLTKQGAGVLALTNTGNAYTGMTTVSGGVLRALDLAVLPAASNLTLNGGLFETGTTFSRALGTGAGQVQLSGGASGFSAFNAPATVNLGGAGATITWGSATFNPTSLVLNTASSNNTLDFQNSINLSGTTRTFAGNNATAISTVSGVISNSTGTAGATINGSGVIAFSGTNTYNGSTTLTAGTLSVDRTENLGAATAPLIFGGGIIRVTGTSYNSFGARPVTLNANATVGFNIADAANNFTFGSTFTTGQILNKSGSGTLTLSAATNVVTRLNVTDGILDLGDSILQVNNGGSSTIQTPSGNGTINASGTGSIALTVSDGDAGAASGSTLTINAPITGAFRFENFFATNGTGVTVLANPNNTYSGGTAVNSSVLSVSVINNTGTPGNLGTGGTINIANAGSTLRYTGTGETNNRVINLTGTTLGGILEMAGTGLFKMTGGVTATGAGSKALSLIGSTSGVGELGGIVANNSPTNITSLVKDGTGTWRLSGANTFTGGVNVIKGSLIVTNNSALGTGTKTITLSNGTAGNPQLQLDGSGGDITLPGTFTYQTSNVTGNGGAIVNLAGNNTIQGTINPFSGGGDTAIAVKGGSLTISANVTQAANSALRNLRFRGEGDGFLTGTVTDGVTGATVGIVQEGTGTWEITGNTNTFSGGVAVTSGTLLANNASGSATGTSTVTVSGTGVLGGLGFISGAVNINAGGTLNPGDGLGTLSIASAVTFSGNSTLSIGLEPSNLSNPSDKLALTGAGASGLLTLTGISDILNLVPFEDIGMAPQTFTIASFVSEMGSFDSVFVNGLASQSVDNTAANYVNVIYNATNIQVEVANLVVPEPATSSLLALAGLGLCARRRRN